MRWPAGNRNCAPWWHRMSAPDIQILRTPDVRWQILRTLHNGAPFLVHQQVPLLVVRALYPDASEAEIRRELDYLAKRGLAQIDKGPDETGSWRAELTRDGVDVAEYTVVCDPGIARPPKYWKG